MSGSNTRQDYGTQYRALERRIYELERALLAMRDDGQGQSFAWCTSWSAGFGVPNDDGIYGVASLEYQVPITASVMAIATANWFGTFDDPRATLLTDVGLASQAHDAEFALTGGGVQVGSPLTAVALPVILDPGTYTASVSMRNNSTSGSIDFPFGNLIVMGFAPSGNCSSVCD